MTKKLPFHSISQPPKEYNASNSISRMIEGLGFRYYWATEGLRSKDLNYRPSQEAKSTIETLKHLYVLSKTIAESIQN